MIWILELSPRHPLATLVANIPWTCIEFTASALIDIVFLFLVK
jgi:hypothetical protein